MNEYIDLYLKFNSENQANSVLFNTQIFGNETIKIPKYTAIDIIGIIYKPSGNMIQSEEGEFPEMIPLEGWHVNVRVTPEEDISKLEAYRIPEPKAPLRVWA